MQYKTIQLRLRANENAALRRLCAIDQRKPTELLRELVRDRAVQCGVWTTYPTDEMTASDQSGQ